MRLVSNTDTAFHNPSVNFVEEALEGFFESRYVRKVRDYFICYLSSQSGCNRGCKFCFLTAMKQTKLENTRPVDYMSQASKVLKQYIMSGDSAGYMHYNFMARGEALANPYLLEGGDQILFDLGNLATSFDPDLSVKFNMSTIMPRDLPKPLTKVFKVVHPTMYYSLYSVNPEFRKKWMPNAMEVPKALDLLKEYQEMSKKVVKIHYCFIEGENDSLGDIDGVLSAVINAKLDSEFNLVRYNPYSPLQGQESSNSIIERNMRIIEKHWPGRVKVIPRVGRDVFASCGMFPGKKNIQNDTITNS